jgi:carnitine O-palmitoyltransferase 2
VVNYRGFQYKVTVADENRNPLPEEQIYARLRAIVETNPTPNYNEVGILTSMERSRWHGIRTEMLRDPINAKSFEDVDSALFVINLDLDLQSDFLNCKKAIQTNRDFLVRDRNRWWDKSFSVTLTNDGALGVNFEHSWGDGVAVLRYTQDVFNDSVARASSTMNRNAPPTEPIQQLQWKLSPGQQNAVAMQRENLQRTINNMDFYILNLDAFGRKHAIFKSLTKPDPFMQVAFQLAWWRLNRSTVSTYESASTAAFLKGRTECIRSATIESQAFTLLMDKPTAGEAEKLNAMIAAMKKHAALSKEAKMGNGVDRHLFALKQIAGRITTRPIEIFMDPAYATFGSNILSTSSLYSDALVGGGFGPVSPGYGIGYAAADQNMMFNVSCWKSGGPAHSAEEFCSAIYQAAVDMHNIVDARSTDAVK